MMAIPFFFFSGPIIFELDFGTAPVAGAEDLVDVSDENHKTCKPSANAYNSAITALKRRAQERCRRSHELSISLRRAFYVP